MGLLNKFPLPFRRSLPVGTKSPNFVVSNFTKNTSFQNIIDQDNNRNYFDQYILYVYKCIEFISDSILDFPPVLKDLKNNELEGLNLQIDLEHFNDYQTFSEARKLREIHLRLTGAAVWVMQESDNPKYKREFYILDPTKFYIKTDNYGLPAYYEYEDGNGEIIRFEKEEIIYFRRANPRNWFEGYSQLEPVKFLSNAFSAGSQMNMNRMLNGGMPDFMLYFDDISEEEREKIEYSLRSKYGGTKNTGKQAVVTQKPEKIDLSSTNRDLEYIRGMEMLRQDILALFGVPEALVFPSSTNANTKESLKIYQLSTIRPALRLEADILNEQLIPKYYSNDRLVDNIFFQFENPVETDKEAQSTVVKNYTDAGLTINQALDLAGLEPVEDGDVRTNTARTEDTTNEVKREGVDKTKGFSLTKESAKYERKLFKEKALRKAIQEENILLEITTDFLRGQALRFIETYKDKKPTLRTLPKKEIENQIVKEAYRVPIEGIIANVNGEANTEIREKLYKVNMQKFLEYKVKGLSPQAIEEISAYLDRFADEINKTTLAEFKKVVSEGIKNGFDTNAFASEIADMFNKYLDGKKNKDILQKLGLYIEEIKPDGSTNTPVRYKDMLKNIVLSYEKKEITYAEYEEALKALRGVLDTSNPIGAEVDQMLDSIYKVPKTAGITQKRATTIARTTATYSRNLALEETYDDNPFVVGKEWVAVGDSKTRPDHAGADGQVVPIDAHFIVDGEKLSRPGDPDGSASNVINCRCRIVGAVE